MSGAAALASCCSFILLCSLQPYQLPSVAPACLQEQREPGAPVLQDHLSAGLRARARSLPWHASQRAELPPLPVGTVPVDAQRRGGRLLKDQAEAAGAAVGCSLQQHPELPLRLCGVIRGVFEPPTGPGAAAEPGRAGQRDAGATETGV